MTATDGAPALSGADAPGPAGHRALADRTSPSRAAQLRMALALARAEAWLLARSLLVLAGLLAGGAVVWLVIGAAGKEPLWWNAGWRIGAGQLVIAMAVLVAAQLAAGRARRNAMADLYASFPATASTRIVAHLAGLAGAVPASLLLIGAATAVVQARDPIGAPGIAVLTGGVLLVIAAGAAGVAVGARFPHPLAGVLGALVLLISSGQSHLPWAAGVWLYPWESFSDQLSGLPGPVAGYPPATAHAVELAGLTVLAGVVALVVAVSRARARGWLAAAGIVALAVTCFAGSVQVRPIPATELNHLVGEVADPASAQHCTTVNQVRYCFYPGFGSLLASVDAPVNAVLARLPARPAQPLTVRQVVLLSLPDPTLTHGHPNREVSQWIARVQRAPGNVSITPATAIYLPVGNWPATGGQLADAHFDLALATAQWAVGLPGTSGSLSSGGGMPCVPVNQAREAVAIWLAILATHPPAGELQDGLGTGTTTPAVVAGNTAIRGWDYPGVAGGYVTPPGGGPRTTAAGYLLASAMMSLPQHKVSHILSDEWARWLNWRTTDTKLAAALGLRMPSVSSLPAPPNGPQAPLCTA